MNMRRITNCVSHILFHDKNNRVVSSEDLGYPVKTWKLCDKICCIQDNDTQDVYKITSLTVIEGKVFAKAVYLFCRSA